MKKALLVVFVIIASGLGGPTVYAVSPILWGMWILFCFIGGFLAGSAKFD